MISQRVKEVKLAKKLYNEYLVNSPIPKWENIVFKEL